MGNDAAAMCIPTKKIWSGVHEANHLSVPDAARSSRCSLPGNELCAPEEHAAFKEGKGSRGGGREREEEEEEGNRRRRRGELRLRSNRGKAFGCRSKLSSPQWAGREREGESVWRGWGGGVGGLKGNRLAREIEKECEGVWRRAGD